jgi:hypothetical protein
MKIPSVWLQFPAAVAALLVTACTASPTDQNAAYAPGASFSRYSLTTIDGETLPCCASGDASGVRVTVVAGSLTFFHESFYRDTVFTPAGPMSKACVHEVPNGGHVSEFTNVVTLPDGTSYMLLPCDRGFYAFGATQRFDYPDGSSRTDSLTLSFGSFKDKPDTLVLTDLSHAGAASASVAGATIVVTATGHQYRLAPKSPYAQ